MYALHKAVLIYKYACVCACVCAFSKSVKQNLNQTWYYFLVTKYYVIVYAINNTYVKHYRKLLNKMNNININNKSLACLDIKLLYTNIPLNKCIEYF